MVNTNRLGALLAVAAAALVAVGLVVLVLVVEARPAGATFPGKNGRIAFASYQMLSGGAAPDSVIYKIKAGGRGKFQVTHSNTTDSTPDYSPNGKRIAYANIDRRNPRDDWEIYTINATGGKPFQVTHNNTNDFAPSYSPDGKKIAYEGSDGNDSEIYTINAGGGGGKSQLTHNKTEADASPSWGSRYRLIRSNPTGVVST